MSQLVRNLKKKNYSTFEQDCAAASRIAVDITIHHPVLIKMEIIYILM